MVNLENNPFLTELTKLFEAKKANGSIFMTLKRSDMQRRLKSNKSQPLDDEQSVCLVRVTDGRRKKIATCVKAKDAAKFSSSYNTILKVHMDSLKRPEKQRAKAKPKDK